MSLPHASLRFECERGQVRRIFVQVDGEDVADLSMSCAGVSFESRPSEVAIWTVRFCADLNDDGDALHRTIQVAA